MLSRDLTFRPSQCQVQEYNKRHCHSEWEDYTSLRRFDDLLDRQALQKTHAIL